MLNFHFYIFQFIFTYQLKIKQVMGPSAMSLSLPSSQNCPNLDTKLIS